MTYAEETKLKFRGAAKIGSAKEKVTIEISQEMLAIDHFKKIEKNYSSLTAYAKKMDMEAKPRKKMKFRSAEAGEISPARIYEDYSNSVVYIYNPEVEAIGSGSLIDRCGLVITNWHVIDKAEVVGVWTKPKKGEKLEEQSPLGAAVMAIDKKADLALIRVAGFPKTMRVVPKGNMNEINIGANVYAIGHPQGLPWSFTIGVVSQIRPDHEWTYVDKSKHKADLIQTQTPISPGNSGGPLFSGKGKLVGVNTTKAGGENLNFAVAINDVKKFINKYPNLCKSNPGSAQMKKDYPNAITGDHNKNGVIDTWYVDSDNNGKIDTGFIDDDEDGLIEGVLIDENENGVWEVLVIDEDLDGRPDKVFIDENEDKTPDVVGYDYDQDGKWDKYEKLS